METIPENNETSVELSRATHLFMLVCILMCVLFVIWAYFGKLDIVSVADGKVVPSSMVKSIQHLEGGIVRELPVKQGDMVKAGQPLVILEKTASGASVEEIMVRISSLRADIARLEAEIDEREKIEIPEDLVRDHPELIQDSRELFQMRMKRYKSELASMHEKVIQREQDISEIDARLKNNRQGLALLEEQVAISEELLKDDLTTQYNHLSLLREATKLRSKVEEDTAALERAESSLQEAREKAKETKHTFRERAGKELKESKQEFEEFTQRLRKYSDSLQRTVIRSPVDGVVKTLYIVTNGGVIKPGETIMDIVPGDDRLVIEAHLRISDIGYVQAGQRAVVQLASRDSRRFGKLEGKVVHVSPDTFVTQQGGAFYTVRIETEKDYFERKSLQYKLYPGVQVLAFIHTGQRTVFEYLMDPFLNTLSVSMQER